MSTGGAREWESDDQHGYEEREGRSAVLTATVCVALSGAGLATALLTAWRRRFRAATRLAAVSLLPIGLYLAGLVTLGRRVGVAVGDWSADLVFKPTVWIGFAVLAFAVVLYLASRVGRNRAARKAARGGEGGASVAPGAASAALSPAGRTPAVASGSRQPEKARRSGSAGKAEKGGKDGEFDDIEAILRKHGI